jgi:hypothetical protein
MQATTEVVPVSKTRLWTGRILSTLIVLMLILDSVMKFMKPAPVVVSCVHLGISESIIVPLGFVLLICTILYAIPNTSFLGAILLTGYLGGAVAIHLRAGDPLFSHVLFPVYLGILVWAGLFLRDDRLQALVPLRS